MKFPEFKYFPLIWIVLLMEIILMVFLKPVGMDSQLESTIAVFIHALVVLFVLLTVPLRLKNVFIFAFLFRVIFMVWDLYARNIFELPNSGADSEMYYHNAMAIYNNFSLINEKLRGSYYAKFLGTLFYLLGPQRMFAHYLNVLFGLFVVVTVYKVMQLLDISVNVTRKITFVSAFFPNSLVMSAILLREIIPTFFVALSLYYFISWYKWSSNKYIVLSLLMLGLASVFHSGVIGIFVGYAFFYLFFKREINSFGFNSKSLSAFIIVGALVFLASSQFGDMLFGKFEGADDMADIYLQANSRYGGSAYLTGITINNPIQFLFYGPLKAFYFLTSPLPLNWRGGMDIFTFVFDSSLYFITLYFIYKNWRFNYYDKKLIVGLIITLVGVSLIFGIGVGNAGSAVRHRQKIVPLILILLALVMNEKERFRLTANQVPYENL